MADYNYKRKSELKTNYAYELFINESGALTFLRV